MPKELTPTFTVISKACDGDETAISKILEFYDPFINQCCYASVFTMITTTCVLR